MDYIYLGKWWMWTDMSAICAEGVSDPDMLVDADVLIRYMHGNNKALRAIDPEKIPAVVGFRKFRV
jgi:hypothetical protein